VRKAYAELGLDYDKQLATRANFEVSGEDAFCKKPIAEPRKAGEIWIEGEGILPFSSTACTLGAYADFKAKGKKINVAYLYDTARGIKLFADQAFYAVGSNKNEIAPFLLKKDAEAYAAKNGGKVVGFAEALKSVVNGG
jgi:NitT/TauT family transport system substrate-binding protein